MRALAAVLFGSVVALSAIAEPAPQTAESAGAAQWKVDEFNFPYSGFTARYSCQGLRDTLRRVLLTLGARKEDLKVGYLSCGADSTRAQPYVSLKIHMARLVPATDAAPQEALQAHWHAIDLTREARLESGDCELQQQIESLLLKHFTTRNGDAHLSCPSHNLPTSAQAQRLEVLQQTLSSPAPSSDPH